MPSALSTSHKLTDNMAMPYVTFGSPISKRAGLREGFNTLTALDGVMRRRPGFSTKLERQLTTFTGQINNIFTWQRFSGSFFCMLSVAANNTSQVWKLEIGVDANFVQLLAVPGTAPFHFISRVGACFFGNGTGTVGINRTMYRYDGKAGIIGWGIMTPAVAPTCTIVDNGLQGIDCSVDYHYRQTYWDATTGHESSPSDISPCLGQWTKKAVQIIITASQEGRVTHIRLYRTRDGGSTDPTQMQELPNSPFPNVTATVTDYANDADLRNQFAPQEMRNDPPPPMKNFTQTDSRIFGSLANGVSWSGFDEIANGVDAECFPGGNSGNYWQFAQDVGGLAAMSNTNGSGVSVFMPGKVAEIDGDLIGEMRRYTVDMYHGTRQHLACFGVGNEVAWYDIARQVRLSTVGDISEDIRPDLSKVDPTKAQLVPYVSGLRNWLVLLDGGTGTLYVLDSDTGNWQTPWPVSATAIWSGEIAPGQRVLLAAIKNQIWYLTEGTWNDLGNPYAARFRTSLIPVTVQPYIEGVRTSFTSTNPEAVQGIDSVSIERNITQIKDIKVSLDELPSFDDSYLSVMENEDDPTHRSEEGKHLIQKRFTVENTIGVAQRVSVWIEWDAKDVDFELYSISVETHTYEMNMG